MTSTDDWEDLRDDEDMPEEPENEIVKGYNSEMLRILGLSKKVVIDHTKREESPRPKRETKPDILDRMRKEIESQPLPDLQPPRPRKGRDPYDVFRSHKKRTQVSMISNEEIEEIKADIATRKPELSDAERRAIAKYYENLQEIEARSIRGEK